MRTSATTVVPAVILSNGYDNNYDDTGVGGQKTTAASSALYILNANTGALIKKIPVTDSAGVSQGLACLHQPVSILARMAFSTTSMPGI